MNEKKIEAIARLSFERHWVLRWDDTKDPVRCDWIARVNEILTEASNRNPCSLRSMIQAMSVAWDTAIASALDAIEEAKESLECEEASGAYDALRAVGRLK